MSLSALVLIHKSEYFECNKCIYFNQECSSSFEHGSCSKYGRVDRNGVIFVHKNINSLFLESYKNYNEVNEDGQGCR